MKKGTFLLLIIFFINVYVYGEVDFKELAVKSNGVIKYIEREEDLLDEIEAKPCLVEFRAEWCNWCHEGDEAFIEMCYENNEYSCVYVYEEQIPKFVADYGINSFPSQYYFFRYSEENTAASLRYSGYKTQHDFMDWRKHVTNNPIDVNSVNSFIGSNEYLLLSVRSKHSDDVDVVADQLKDLHDAFYFSTIYYEDLKAKADNHVFIFGENVDNQILVEGSGGFYILQKIDKENEDEEQEGDEDYRIISNLCAYDDDEEEKEKDLRKKILLWHLPLLGRVTVKNLKYYKEIGLPMVRIFVDDYERDISARYRKGLEKMARQHREYLLMGIFERSNWKLDSEKFNTFSDEDHHVDIVIDTFGDIKYKFDDPMIIGSDEEDGDVVITKFLSIYDFLRSYMYGKLPIFLKSQAHVQPSLKGESKKIVDVIGKTFHEIIFDETKHVFVEFYSPNCGFCKKVLPDYDKLADDNTDESLVIARMDATQNDAPPEFKIRGYPSFYFVSKYDNTIIEYDAKDRDFLSMKSWISQTISSSSSISEEEQSKVKQEL